MDFTSATSRFSLVSPENVLGGVMVVDEHNGKRTRGKPVELEAYVPGRSRLRKFVMLSVELLRRVSERVREVRVRRHRARRRSARGGIAAWVRRLGRLLVG